VRGESNPLRAWERCRTTIPTAPGSGSEEARRPLDPPRSCRRPSASPPRPDEKPREWRQNHAVKTDTLLACGAVAGPGFVIAFLVEGATRAEYDPLRHPVSSLALGDYGWTQIVNFIVTGLLMLAFAVGLRRALRPGPGSTWGPLLIALVAIGLTGAGIFVTDPLSGYPPGTPERLEYTPRGVLHDIFSLPVFTALPAASFVFTRVFAKRGQRGWAAYSAVTGVVFIVAFLLASVGFDQAEGLVAVAGLFQRIALTVGLGWLALLAIHVRRRRSEWPGAVPIDVSV
jgi:hypothetical membrane protein